MTTPEATNEPFLHPTQLDDLATTCLIDATYETWICRKFNPTWISTQLTPQRELTRRTIADYIQNRLNVDAALNLIATQAGFQEMEHFGEQLALYLPMYHRKCGWEIIPTDQYGANNHEGAVRARSPFAPGDKIRDLIGKMCKMSSDEIEALPSSGHLSLIERNKTGAEPENLTGPLRFVNHRCNPNARFSLHKAPFIVVNVIRPIAVGDEITVSYHDDFFGDECRCPDHNQPSFTASSTDSAILKNEALMAEVLTRHRAIYNADFPATTPTSHGRSLRSHRSASAFVHSETYNSPPKDNRRITALQQQQIRQNMALSPMQSSRISAGSHTPMSGSLATPLRSHVAAQTPPSASLNAEAQTTTALASPPARSNTNATSFTTSASGSPSRPHHGSASSTVQESPAMMRIKCALCKRKVKGSQKHISHHLTKKHPEIKNRKTEQEKCEPCNLWHPRPSRNDHFTNKHGGKILVNRPDATVFDPRTLQFVVRRRKIGPKSKHYKAALIEEMSSDSESASELEDEPSIDSRS